MIVMGLSGADARGQAAPVLGDRGAFYVNYAAGVPVAPLRLHEWSIVHRDARLYLAAAQAAGNRVLAYRSLGEMAADAPSCARAPDGGFGWWGLSRSGVRIFWICGTGAGRTSSWTNWHRRYAVSW